MAYRRIAPLLVLLVMGLAACAGSSGDSSGGGAIAPEDPVGAPSQPGGADPTGVIKGARVDIDVVRNHLTSAAQDVIDLTTSHDVGGFLVSSVVDVNQGTGNVRVKVPASNFEPFVSRLNSIGHTTRQELKGQDVSAHFFRLRARVQQLEEQLASLLAQLDATGNSSEQLDLRQEIAGARDQLRHLQRSRDYIAGQTTYSTVGVSLFAVRPAPAPPKPALTQSLENSKSISLAIVSGILLTLSVVLPFLVLAFVLYLIGAPVVRRFRASAARKEADLAL